MLVTVPWAEALGGAEAMLQAVLDGAGEEQHELELVFFDDGSWPRELAAGDSRRGVRRRPPAPAPSLAATVLRLARFRARRPA